ncbi:hypothetical protein U1Q18_045621 [Sarracenia purpurea var. burkii]
MGYTRLDGVVGERYVDVSVYGGENQVVVGEDDAGDSTGKAAETVAVVGAKGRNVEPGWEVEETDRAVGESGSQVVVGDGEAGAGETLLDVVVVVAAVVGGDEVERGVFVSSHAEVVGGAVAEDEFVAPRRVEEAAAVPDTAGEILPEEIGARHRPPCRAYLHPKQAAIAWSSSQ